MVELFLRMPKAESSAPTTGSSSRRVSSIAGGRADAWSHLELQAHRREYSKNSGKVRKLFVAESAIDACTLQSGFFWRFLKR